MAGEQLEIVIQYINIAENNMIVDFDRLVEIEPAVLAIYSLPVGTDLAFDSDRKAFIDANTGKEYYELHN